MNRRALWTLGVTLLASLPAISLSGCSSTSSDVAYRDDYESGYSNYHFSSQPRMRRVGDTDVYYIRDASDYDVYQFEGTWYLNDQGRWYRAGSWRGPWTSLDVDVLPNEIATVPSEYRRNWVSVRVDRRDPRYRDLPEGYWASGRTFSRKPSMAMIPNSSVTYARQAADFDLYRLHGTWYLMDNGVWYRSTSWRGPFLTIRTSSVPSEVLTIPSRYRRDWVSSTDDRDRYRDRDWRDRDRDDDRYSTVRYWNSGRTFTVEPSYDMIPGTDIDYVRGNASYDLYRYNDSWYLADRTGWYRADSWRGPFISIQLGSVPRAVISVPMTYRRYWSTD
ncbi:MAG TPA: hypothetical protein VE326_12590 [Candidatus Binatia bacterium]|nr:hypothetical protein [Candidatus Binatia bacterium]